MNKKFMGIISIFLALTLLLGGCGKITKTKPVETAGSENESSENRFAQVLTSHYWLNDFQALSLYQFTEDGKVLKYYYTSTASVENTEGYYDYYAESWHPDPNEMVLQEDWSGTYTLEGTIVNLRGKQGDYSYDVELDYSGIAKEAIKPYLSRYDGQYFLYENQFEPDLNAVEEAPFYLFAVGMPEDTEEPQKEQSVRQGWQGVYRYDDGDQGLYYFITSASNSTVSGLYIYSTAQGNYEYGNFSWQIESNDGNIACELFQNGTSYIYYHLGDNGIAVDYPKGWWADRDYAYVCSIADISKYVNHPLTNDILQELSTKTRQEESSNTASVIEPFYGIWVFASKEEAECNSVITDLKSKGFDAKVYQTTDWENLNKEAWFVVSTGEYRSKEAAQESLSRVQSGGYSSAYVKYTGNRVR